ISPVVPRSASPIARTMGEICCLLPAATCASSPRASAAAREAAAVASSASEDVVTPSPPWVRAVPALARVVRVGRSQYANHADQEQDGEEQSEVRPSSGASSPRGPVTVKSAGVQDRLGLAAFDERAVERSQDLKGRLGQRDVGPVFPQRRKK